MKKEEIYNKKAIGDLPVNSRIKVIYPEKGEPQIKFEYPESQAQLKDLWQTSGIYIISFPLTVITIIFLYILLSPVFFPSTGAQDCNIYSINKNGTKVNLYCQNINNETKVWQVEWEEHASIFSVNSRFVVHENHKENKTSNLKVLFISLYESFVIIVFFSLAYFILIRLYGKTIVYFIKKTRVGNKYYPSWNKKMHDKKYTAEFKECPNNLEIEIPLFHNIYLDYEAEGDFADYLSEVEIMEHDFVINKRGSKGQIKRKIHNVILWKAIFRFKKKPIKGILKVNFT